VGNVISKIGTLFYFAVFILMAWWSTTGQPKLAPDRIVFHAH